MLYYFKQGKNATEMQKKICVVHGEGAVTDWMCQKWFVKFHAGNFLLDDAPQLGRPVEVDSNQIETLTENHRCYTTQEMWHTQNIQINKVIGKMKNVSFILWKKLNGLFGQPNIYWVPTIHTVY